MNPKVILANGLWLGSSLPAARRFHVALAEPEKAQTRWLRACCQANANAAFSRAHGIGDCRSYAEFADKVPVTEWTDYEPWIDRMRDGEANTLCSAPITHLAPTSGSSGARKLIPFSRPLHRSFAVAVGAWMLDLVRQRPSLLQGSSYWSVSPLIAQPQERSAVRIGFADDADYLGRIGAWLTRQSMVASSSLRHIKDPDAFWFQTALAILARADLALISIWHPSFLQLLIEAIQANWDALLSAIHSGSPSRARALSKSNPQDPDTWWPRLEVISCWGEQAANPGILSLRMLFPRSLVQAKGLLATEAVVTFPWRGSYPLAVNSHFFEFIDETGRIVRAHELSPGRQYEILLTNGGGLWRYRLQDLVECSGWMRSTPCLRFLGRIGRVSDLRGEKLSECFVAEALRSLYPESGTLCWLQAELSPPRYALHSEDTSRENLCQLLDEALGQNPHYRYARQLGQLKAPIVVPVEKGSEARRIAVSRQGVGNAKPRVLVLSSEV